MSLQKKNKRNYSSKKIYKRKEFILEMEGIAKLGFFNIASRYETFIIVGILMIIGTVIKLLGFADFSSDWFWLLAGIGLMVEGTISLVKQKRFEKKYKIIERKEKHSINKI